MTTFPPSHVHHYSPQEIADMLQLSVDTVRNIFKEMHGVVKIERPRANRKARPYVTLRIPDSTFRQWYDAASSGWADEVESRSRRVKKPLMARDKRGVMTLSGADTRMPKQVGNGSEVSPILKQTTRKRVSEAMGPNVLDLGDGSEPGQGHAGGVLGSMRLTATPKKPRIMRQAVKGSNNLIGQLQGHADAGLLSSQRQPLMLPVDPVPAKHDDITDAQPGVQSQQNQGAGAVTMPIPVAEVIAGSDQGSDLLLGEGQRGGRIPFGHPESFGGIVCNPSACGAEREERAESGEFLASSGRLDTAGRAELREVIGCNCLQDDSGLKQAQEVGVIADGGLGQVPCFAIRQVGGDSTFDSNASDRGVSLQLGHSTQTLREVNSVQRLTNAATIHKPVGMERTVALKVVHALRLMRAGAQVAALNLKHGFDSDTRTGTMKGESLEAQ